MSTRPEPAAGRPGVDTSAVQVTEALLRGWPLPRPGPDGDKEERGRTLVIAGSREMPGAALLAATAVLRAGAGKLAVATAAGIAAGVALALPEARVMALPESAAGGLAAAGAALLESSLRKVDVVLVGPGLLDEDESCRFVESLLPLCGEATVVLDALAMGVVANLGRFQRPVLMTPHAGEMAHLCGGSKAAVLADPAGHARDAAKRWNAVVALKGARTHIADREGRLWLHEGGNAGLGTSGSGDTLAGLIAGLAARGATLEQASVWGIALHALAGRELAARRGPLGYLARELAEEVPRLMHVLSLD
jgi:ADP-dependent NAD(P)H-hydrate dehydratase